MTVGDALKWGVACLDKQVGASVDSRREARDLLCRALGRDHAWLIAHDRDELPDESLNRYGDLMFRRTQKEPLAYVLGDAWFLGRVFKVTPATLIPRPATEHIVEAALTAAEQIGAEDIIDVGTGSGVVAVSLALGRPESRVWATDVSADALSVARENADRARVERIGFLQGNLLEPLPDEIWRDPTVLVANLPYIPENDWGDLAEEIRKFEPRSALVSGADGLDHYRELIDQLLKREKSNVALCVEILPKQEPELTELLRRAWPKSEVETVRNLAGDAIGLTCLIR